MNTYWGVLTHPSNHYAQPVSVHNDLINMEFYFISAEEHQWSAEVTHNPVETGVNITDHIQRKPDQLNLTGMISNSPINVIQASSDTDRETDELPVKKAFDKLYQLIEQRQLLTVYTKYRQYPNMVLTHLAIPRKAEDGNAIEFTANFEHVRVVSTLLLESHQAGIYPECTDSQQTKQKTTPTKKKGMIQPTVFDQSRTHTF